MPSPASPSPASPSTASPSAAAAFPAGPPASGRDLGLVALALSSGTDWRRTVRFDPAQRWYARIAATDTYEAWLLSWLPGQRTGPHDHGGSAGAFLVLQGELDETAYGTARITEAPGATGAVAATASTRLLVAGAVRRFGERHIHDVRAAGPVPAVSLHVYAPALTRMTRYDWDGERLMARATEAAGADW